MAADRTRWWEVDGWPSDLTSFVIVVRAFLEERISAAEFERLYLNLFSGDPYHRPQDAFRSLEAMFFAVEEFELDETLRDEEDLDEVQLREAIAVSLERLSAAKDDPNYRAEREGR